MMTIADALGGERLARYPEVAEIMGTTDVPKARCARNGRT
ncbi:hypothetical protein CBM2634_U170001 [Cupriavidus taiwanensis]|uniref:Uncharacterized protein n=1 Tax=Cupriavidus taiwanensis TaxID=164546 RepID=A0A375JEK8_9BURK|nr:hypothetical protein CBM2634_U170001 [Cupriavidus taiwanensis]